MNDGTFGTPEDDRRYSFAMEQRVLGRTIKGVRYYNGDEPEPGKRGVSITFHFDDGGALGIFIEGPAKISLLVPKVEVVPMESRMTQ